MSDETSTLPPEYLRRVNAALALREIPDYSAALTQLALALELAPQDTSILLLMGITYQDLDQLDAAEENLRQAYELSPESKQVTQALGLLLVQREQYEEAHLLLESLVRDKVHDPIVAQGLATALEKQGKGAEAIEVLEESLAHFPEESALLNQLGRSLLTANRIDEAEGVLAAATDLNATPDNLLDLSRVLTRQKKVQQALAALERAVQLTEEDDRLWRATTRCLLLLGEIEQANEVAQKAISLDTENPRNWQNLAQTQFELRAYSKAFDSLTRSEELLQGTLESSVLWTVLYDRALMSLRAYGVRQALDVVEHDLPKIPDHKGLYHLQINLLLAISRYDSALVSLDKAHKEGLILEGVSWDYFHAYYGLNRPDDAWRALPNLPADSDEREHHLTVLESIAIRLYQKDYMVAAQDIFQKVLEIEPSRARSLNNLGFIVAGEEEWEEAEELFNKALAYIKEGPENSSMTQDVTLANLGYVYLRQQKLDESLRALKQAEKIASEEVRAILRIAFWLKSGFSSTVQERYPKRFINPFVAIRANLATAHFLKGNISMSLEIAQSIVDKHPETAIGSCVLGCILFSTDDLESAHVAWERAHEVAKSKSEQELIESWLSALPEPSSSASAI